MTWDLLVLSPHLDDAVLSCGGQIAGLTTGGGRALVATVGTADEGERRSPVAAMLHRAWKLDGDVVAARRAEDLEACRRVGAEALHIGLPEAIYRFTEAGPLYPELADLFGPVHGEDEGMVATIAARIADLPAARLTLAPVGLGGHVDHVLLRRAAERAVGGELALYDEFPYSEEAAAEALVDRGRWRPEVVPVAAAAAAAKRAAVAAYRSQIGPLLGGRLRMKRRLARALAVHGGERRWRRVPAD